MHLSDRSQGHPFPSIDNGTAAPLVDRDKLPGSQLLHAEYFHTLTLTLEFLDMFTMKRSITERHRPKTF